MSLPLREPDGLLHAENVNGSALAYSAAWIAGNGCIPLNYLMEDAATAEIARVQLWQWVRYGSTIVRPFLHMSHVHLY